VSSRYPTLAILALSAFRAASASVSAAGPGRVEAEPPAILPALPRTEAETEPRPLAELGRPRANGDGLDSDAVTVPVEAPSGGEAPATGPRADAGDDLLGMVGRQVTFNGARSEPKGKLGYRWLQLSGPKVRRKREDGYVLSFVPATTGTYRFALVVALGSEISEPDTVTVTVTVAPPSATAATPAALPERVPVPSPIDEAARAALATVPGGGEASAALAEAFAGVADRMDLYRSYVDVYQELCHRLGRILPADQARRAAWDERLFAPLTARLIEALRAEGLDLRQPEGQRAELSAGQRARLTEQFQGMAEGFRATSPPG